MTMNATRLGDAIVDGMKTISTFSATQETASRANMVKLAQAVIDEIEDYYSGGGGGTPSDDDPEPLGATDPGASTLYSRGDHVHEMPDAADVGADPAGTAASAITTHLGAAPHVSLSSSTPAALGTAAAGSGTTSARSDHVHAMPSAANVGALALDGSNSPTAHLNLGGYRITNAGAATSGSGLTTLDQVNGLLEGRSFADPVISATTGTPPGSPTTGDRYIVPVGAGGAWTSLVDLIVEWDGATWDAQTPAEGWTVAVQDTGTFLRYNDAYPAGDWTNLGSAVDHAALINRAWAASGHTGTASRLAGFDGSGAATYFQIGADVQAYDADLAAVAAGTWTGATSITTLGDVVTCDKLAAGGSGVISVAGTSISWRLRATGTGGSLLAAEYVGSRINSTHPGVSMVTTAARASGASPAALSSGDPLWEHYVTGYDGSGYFPGARARVVAAAAPSSGIIPSKWEWYTTSVGGATLVQATLDSADGLTLTAPLAIASGGHGQATAAAGFDALKQVGTSTSSGVYETATWLEGQTATEARVTDARDWWVVYNQPGPWSGSWWANRVSSAVTVGGTGILAALTASGTFSTKAHSTTYGPYWSIAQSTSAGAERAIYPALTSNSWTFDESKYVRHLIWLGASSVSTSRVLYGWAVAGGTLTTPATTTRHFACGIWEGALQIRAADGTAAATPVAFSTSPSNDVIYALEVIPQSATSIKVRLYTWALTTGLTWVEDATISNNVPSGSGNIVPVWVARSSSGTPSAHLAGWLTAINKAGL